MSEDHQTDEDPGERESDVIEHYAAVGTGGMFLILAASLLGWGAALVKAGLAGGWPPGLEKLLLPVGVTFTLVGLGAWRLLRMGLPERVFGLPVGGAVLAVFGLAGLIGALL